ncbi:MULTISPECIES: hypothetical protein [Parachlamydia]|jgi:hypothetical protein|uniref:hypothetical protein n=1 Tax=Parachlamydia TaxID=83551 RepID=UPI0001C17307|nr:hypothetical protein [Parachlamydia acanthamoebae]EFB40371.1 hypothetical protein pah_c207o072 [Parachlamydia acanthamoebae str. Hall's coccus]
MQKIVLKNVTSQGIPLEVTFLPEQGMNMASYKKGEIEVIDQSTRNLFEERFAGLGALIGPHFHRRLPATIPLIADESLFPHIARVKQSGVQEPFSHGIGRYAPWKAEFTETTVDAKLNGNDEWKGVSLSSLEGQNFQMHFQAELTQKELKIHFSVVSDTDSLVGLHYYYALPQGKGVVHSRIQSEVIENGEKKPPRWQMDEQNEVLIPIADDDIDTTFYPFPNPRAGKILLDAGSYYLEKRYQCISQENSWQLYHPKNATFVCIEPLSSQDPRHPNLTVSSIQVEIEILDPK